MLKAVSSARLEMQEFWSGFSYMIRINGLGVSNLLSLRIRLSASVARVVGIFGIETSFETTPPDGGVTS